MSKVLLGPAPCQGCGAWVEWNGLAWVALATDEFHDCAPYVGQGWDPQLMVMADDLRAYAAATPTEPRWLEPLGLAIKLVALGAGLLFVALVAARGAAGLL